MGVNFCRCPCHRHPLAGPAVFTRHPDEHVIESAVACDECRSHHEPVFAIQYVPDDDGLRSPPIVLPPMPDEGLE